MGVCVGLLDIGQDTKERIYFRQQYIDRLHEAKAEVLMIPQKAENQKACMREYISRCDGLLLPGGGDIDPGLWAEERKPWAGEPSKIRDSIEQILFSEAKERRLPVLGICRGIQAINVFGGGSLYQDINKEGASKAAWHSDKARKKERVHMLYLEGGSWLSDTLGCKEIGVNSMHHQAVKKVAPGFLVTARSEDGIIEGIEYQGDWFCVGVQWHPEHMAPLFKEQSLIFEEFARICLRYKGAG